MNPEITPSELLATAATDYCIENRDERGDEHLLHVSDTTDCLRAIWYRRRAAAGALEHIKPPFDPATRYRFGRGFGIEAEATKHILWQLRRNGYWAEAQYKIAFVLKNGDVTCRALGFENKPDDMLLPDKMDIVGHIDIIAHKAGEPARMIVVDVKSHLFMPNGVNIKHELQVSQYAYGTFLMHPAADVEAFIYSVSANGDYSPFAVDWKRHVQTIRERMYERIGLTHPGADMPPAVPPPEAYVAKKESRKKDAPTIILNEYCDKFCDYQQCPNYRAGAQEEAV